MSRGPIAWGKAQTSHAKDRIIVPCVWMCSVMYDSLQPHELQLSRLLCPQDIPGKSTRVGCHFLLQVIFLTQGTNLCLLCSIKSDINRPLN